MIRLLKIALREYLAYVRTPGFWLSMCFMPLAFGVTFAAPAMMARSAPAARVAVVDLTGRGFVRDISAALARTGGRARGTKLAVVVPAPIANPTSAEDAGHRLRPLLAGSRGKGDAGLDAVAVIHDEHGQVGVDLWSRNIGDSDLERVVREAVGDRMRADRLVAAGLAPAQVAALDAVEPRVANYSPRAESGQVSFRDRLPGLAGFGMGMLLWAMTMSGAGILLNSVIEEKSSRVLEVLLASASPSEIMGGKILGVAAVTVTVLGVWLTLGGFAISAASPHLATDLAAVLMRHGLFAYFAIYLICGYLMYAALFAAIGAFCETTREAQTLLAPVMMLMSIPIVFMSQAILRPDAPILGILCWIPTFTPFLMPARAASDPPLWQMLGTTTLMVACAVGSLWLSVRAFRAGALSSGKLNAKAFFGLFFRAGRRPA